MKYTVRTSPLVPSAFHAFLAGDPRMPLRSKPPSLLLLLLLLRCPLPESSHAPCCRTAPRCTSTPQTAALQQQLLHTRSSSNKHSLEFMCSGQGEQSSLSSRLEITEQPTNKPVKLLVALFAFPQPKPSGAIRVGKLVAASAAMSCSGNIISGAGDTVMIQLPPIKLTRRLIAAHMCCWSRNTRG